MQVVLHEPKERSYFSSLTINKIVYSFVSCRLLQWYGADSAKLFPFSTFVFFYTFIDMIFTHSH